VKYAFIQEHQAVFSIERMCSMLAIERSGYYAWLHRKPGIRAKANADLDGALVLLFAEHKKRYGSPRLTLELREKGKLCSKNRVARRMQFLGLYALSKKKHKVITTDSKHDLPIAPNLLARDFSASAINQKWVGDISYVWTEEGWLYLAVVMDLYSRAVIGWAMASHMKQSLVCDALLMALWRRGFPRGMIFHSDRGSQYCSNAYQDLLKHYGMQSSMSRKGDCWDNSVCESFFHTLKTELIYGARYIRRELAKQSIFEYIEAYYNRVRRHSTIGFMAPFVFESKREVITGVCL
jgi:putative transposase